ncbi:hypothetical protein HNO53_13035 [Billgrantia antri]|uniref:Uncharacterized protein n=1 Tax=Halomonas sulfidivorans TaxID=2733488 RepID=A0ABX7WGS3_9GAMM|nr:hypothetical protein [Halomonas sulfidivorans]QTP59560.1 hypothetical protein HNO53_13035 [Halomonas sulfidivorans]
MKVIVHRLAAPYAFIKLVHNNEECVVNNPVMVEKDIKGDLFLTYESIVDIAEAIEMKWKIANTGEQMSVAMKVLQAIREGWGVNDTRGEE